MLTSNDRLVRGLKSRFRIPRSWHRVLHPSKNINEGGDQTHHIQVRSVEPRGFHYGR